MATDGEHSTDIFKYRNTWYNKSYPELQITLQAQSFHSEKNDKDELCEIKTIIQEMYWLAAIPTGESIFGWNRLHNTFYGVLCLKHFDSVLYATPFVMADNFRFNRIRWKNDYIENPEAKYLSVVSCYIEKDNIDFLLDNWLCIHQETVFRTVQIEEYCSLEPWVVHPEYYCNSPYDVVPVFENSEEHIQFIKHVKSNANEFFSRIGNYDHVSSPNYNVEAPAYDEQYIAYLCNAGKQVTVK
jgi:hypothetical protein